MLIGIDVGRKNTICATAAGQMFFAPSDTPELLKKLREDAEVFLGDFVDSCAIAASEESRAEELKLEAKKSGFRDVNFIRPSIALARQFGGKILFVNWGAKVDISVADKVSVAESETLRDAGGTEFDKLLAEWIMLRIGENSEGAKKFFCDEAEKIKIALSSCESYQWNVEIKRDDFERLIRFHVRRAIHVFDSFCEKYKCERIFVTGGGSKIPLVRKAFESSEWSKNIVFCHSDVVAKCAAKFELPQKDIENFLEIENEIKKISASLAPNQTGALYGLLSKARTHQSNEIADAIKKALGEISRELRPEPS